MVTVGYESGEFERAEACSSGCCVGVSKLVNGRSIIDGFPSAECSPDLDAGCGSQVEGIAGVCTTGWPLLGAEIGESLGADSGCPKLVGSGRSSVDDCP